MGMVMNATRHFVYTCGSYVNTFTVVSHTNKSSCMFQSSALTQHKHCFDLFEDSINVGTCAETVKINKETKLVTSAGVCFESWKSTQ